MWQGLKLTADGQNALNKAQINGNMTIKSIVVGDGSPPQNFRTTKKLIHQLYEITDLKIDLTDKSCTLTADFPAVTYDYYFREIGVIVTTDEGDTLYVYDNCGDDAQYIVNSTGVESVKKRLRLTLAISDVAEIKLTKESILYVAYDDFEQEIQTLHEQKLTGDGGDASKLLVDFEENKTLETIHKEENLSGVFGKIAKAITSLINHIGDQKNPHKVTKGQIGLGNVQNTADEEKSVRRADYAGILEPFYTENLASFKSGWNPQNSGYVVWGQSWKDARLSADTGDLVVWLEPTGNGQTTANMAIDGKIYALNGFEGNASSASAVPWTGVTGKPGTYPPSDHTHDDRYYTEAEIDQKMNAFGGNLAKKQDAEAPSVWDAISATGTNNYLKDTLCVDLSSYNSAVNRPGYVTNASTGAPPGMQFGIREVFYYNSSAVFVKITGIDSTNQERVYFNFYNGSTWLGWNTMALTDDLKNYLSLSGGTLTGPLKVGVNGKVQIWEDNEGGNILLISPNGQVWELDAFSDTSLRLFTYGSPTNGNKVVGISVRQDGTLESSGVVNTEGWTDFYVGGELAGSIFVNKNNRWLHVRNKTGERIALTTDNCVEVANVAWDTYMPINASAFNTMSSRRYKTNIRDLTGEEAEKLLAVRIVNYDYKKGTMHDGDLTGHTGAIAEETAEVIPEVVQYKEVDGENVPDAIDYSKFVPYIIKVVQMQNEKITQLENALTTLTNNGIVKR